MMPSNYDYTKIGSMIGDVNLYFHEWLEKGDAEIGIFLVINKRL